MSEPAKPPAHGAFHYDGQMVVRARDNVRGRGRFSTTAMAGPKRTGGANGRKIWPIRAAQSRQRSYNGWAGPRWDGLVHRERRQPDRSDESGRYGPARVPTAQPGQLATNHRAR